MTTNVTTSNPVRSDLLESHPHAESRRTSRGWALAGAAAGLCALGTVVLSSMINVVYDEPYASDDHGVAAAIGDHAGIVLAFNAVTVVGALLLVVFAAGLYRRLHGGMRDSLAPAVAAAGLVGTAVVLVMGSGLDTEFAGGDHVSDSAAAMFNHWTGTIPWLYTLVGLTGLAVYAARRADVVPAWIGRVGLVLGGLTALLGASPAQYMAAVPGALFLIVAGLGFAFGDHRHRA